jgi:hypothetical protein
MNEIKRTLSPRRKHNPPGPSVDFQEIWETTWNGLGESEYLSDVMAGCIENRRLAEVEVPEDFLDAKREAEQREFDQEVGPYLTKESA